LVCQGIHGIFRGVSVYVGVWNVEVTMMRFDLKKLELLKKLSIGLHKGQQQANNQSERWICETQPGNSARTCIIASRGHRHITNA
jgi:hypothetical protein